jgi:putative colanic acid biosynthesis acetyltransferase WcaF
MDCPSQHSFPNKLFRVVWEVVWLLLFRPTPWFWHLPRRLVLRLFGASVGKGVQIMPSVKIWAPWNLRLGDYATVSHGVDLYSVGKIDIGAHATVSQRACICTATHAVDHPNMPLVVKPVTIEDGAWIAAEAFVHPGITIGVDAVVAARGVVIHNVPPRQIVGGNPAQRIREREVG